MLLIEFACHETELDISLESTACEYSRFSLPPSALGTFVGTSFAAGSDVRRLYSQAMASNTLRLTSVSINYGNLQTNSGCLCSLCSVMPSLVSGDAITLVVFDEG